MKSHRLSIAAAVSVALVFAIATPSVEAAGAAPKLGEAKNVIVLVPDGCQISIATAARWFKGEELHVDPYARGFMKTYMYNSVITGSAAAATAFATGRKTTARFLSVGPRADDPLSTLPVPGPNVQYAPYSTVLEGAKLFGKSTGLVATSRITHATPAAYAAHIEDRGWDNEIMEHIVYNNVDVVFGGGERHLLPAAAGGRRTDGEDLKQVLLDRGYQYVTNRNDLMSLSSGRAWGMFASSHMAADIDRAEFAPDEPSIAEMTSKAIELLSQDPDGFFLMVEGSQVDWAGHANDPIYMITDFLAFDEAFKTAIDFAKADGNTLVIAFPDHDTGGLTIGHNYTEHGYTATTVEDIVEPLQNMAISAYGVALKIDELGGADVNTIKSGISQWWGLEISDEDAQAILDYMDYAGVSLDYAISHVISQRYTYFGWTTHGHTGTDVPIWSYGPGKPVGTRDNTDLAKRSAVALGFTFGTIQPLLYQEVGKHFPGYTMDTSDPENPILKVGDCSMPVSKDILVVDSLKATYTMPGLTVHAPATGKVYVSLVAIAFMDAINTSGSAITANEAAFEAQVEWRLRELAEREGIDPSIVLAQLD